MQNHMQTLKKCKINKQANVYLTINSLHYEHKSIIKLTCLCYLGQTKILVNVNITLSIKYALTCSTETFTQTRRSSKANYSAIFT